MIISVVIPTFNRAHRIRRAVRSALAQSRPPDEVLVVDDGSTDDTIAALAPLMRHIRYIRKPNGGAASARNRGILQAAGDWIAFLDSDDAWDFRKLEHQAACVSRTGAEACFCLSTDESGAPLDHGATTHDMPIEEFFPAGDTRLFKSGRHPFVQSMLATKDALTACGMFDQTLTVAEDTKLIYRLALQKGYAMVNKHLVTVHRIRESPGLSDTMDAPGAYRRYECYTRVQAEFVPQLAGRDAEAACVLRRNQLYFKSRQAELACALNHRQAARHLALGALDPAAGWKCMARNLFILAAYPLARRHFTRKWGACTRQGSAVPPHPTP